LAKFWDFWKQIHPPCDFHKTTKPLNLKTGRVSIPQNWKSRISIYGYLPYSQKRNNANAKGLRQSKKARETLSVIKTFIKKRKLTKISKIKHSRQKDKESINYLYLLRKINYDGVYVKYWTNGQNIRKLRRGNFNCHIK